MLLINQNKIPTCIYNILMLENGKVAALQNE